MHVIGREGGVKEESTGRNKCLWLKELKEEEEKEQEERQNR